MIGGGVWRSENAGLSRNTYDGYNLFSNNGAARIGRHAGLAGAVAVVCTVHAYLGARSGSGKSTEDRARPWKSYRVRLSLGALTRRPADAGDPFRGPGEDAGAVVVRDRRDGGPLVEMGYEPGRRAASVSCAVGRRAQQPGRPSRCRWSSRWSRPATACRSGSRCRAAACPPASPARVGGQGRRACNRGRYGRGRTGPGPPRPAGWPASADRPRSRCSAVDRRITTVKGRLGEGGRTRAGSAADVRRCARSPRSPRRGHGGLR
jgi:hypothetical protein